MPLIVCNIVCVCAFRYVFDYESIQIYIVPVKCVRICACACISVLCLNTCPFILCLSDCQSVSQCVSDSVSF